MYKLNILNHGVFYTEPPFYHISHYREGQVFILTPTVCWFNDFLISKSKCVCLLFSEKIYSQIICLQLQTVLPDTAERMLYGLAFTCCLEFDS